MIRSQVRSLCERIAAHLPLFFMQLIIVNPKGVRGSGVAADLHMQHTVKTIKTAGILNANSEVLFCLVHVLTLAVCIIAER